MSRPFKLFRLQQIDSQMDWGRTRLKAVEASLLDDSDLRLSQQQLEAVSQELHQATKALRNTEFETQQQRIKIEQTESSLYGGKVRNPKELQDLQNESAALKRYLSVLEERQFEAMLTEEDANTRLKQTSMQRDQICKDHERRMLELNQEKERLQKDLASSESERQAALSTIEAEDLAVYHQLRQKKRGIAVAKVVDRACAACGSTLNASLLNAARSPNHINLCDTCGRILYTG